MNKELISRLYKSFEAETLCADAAEAIEEMQAEVEMWKATSNAVIDMEKSQLRLERDTLRNTLARIEAKVDSTIAERDTLRQQLADAQAVIDASQCKGIPRKGCDYLTACGRVCNKCGEVHSAHQLATVFAAPAIADTVQRDAERYRFLRDNFATKSENSVDDFIALEPMTGEYFDAHIDILMSEFYADKKGAT